MADEERETESQNSQQEDVQQMDVDQEEPEKDKYDHSFITNILFLSVSSKLFVMSPFCFSGAMAHAKKMEGNEKYVEKHYEAALQLYTEAIGNSVFLFMSGLKPRLPLNTIKFI